MIAVLSRVSNSVWMAVWHKSEGMTNLGKRLDLDACSEWRDYSQSVARFELKSNLVEPAAYPELKVSIQLRIENMSLHSNRGS